MCKGHTRHLLSSQHDCSCVGFARAQALRSLNQVIQAVAWLLQRHPEQAEEFGCSRTSQCQGTRHHGRPLQHTRRAWLQVTQGEAETGLIVHALSPCHAGLCQQSPGMAGDG
jgi:hypothetical protein